MRKKTECQKYVTMSYKELRKKLGLESKIVDVHTNIGKDKIRIQVK